MASQSSTILRSLGKNGMLIAACGLLVGLFLWNPFDAMHGGDDISFNSEVRPLLNDKCLVCHGGVRQSGGFSLLFASDALQPTESGKPAIVPGYPDSSEMILRIKHDDPEERMPFDHPPLSDAEIEVLSDWIEAGAEWEEHWAYLKPEREDPPYPKNSVWARNGIDRFILARLEKEGLNPSPEADCRTIYRRLSLDLLGLPPQLDEVTAFCEDESATAYEQAVDGLLSSSRFGERWAAMWLDLARYADSKGYEKDGPREIWKYRDWVISAFNRDMPFDQFTIEQLAGDLLPDPAEDQFIATAFHRNTMNNDEGGTDDEEFRTASVIDRVNTTWEVWMGTTMACVQCHSHPYDPFRMEEYYEFYAFLNNTQDKDTPDESPTLATYSEKQRAELIEALTWIADVEQTTYPTAKTLEAQKNEVLYPGGRLLAGASDEAHDLELQGERAVNINHQSYLVHQEVNLTGVDEISINYSSGEDGGYVEVLLDSLNGRRIARIALRPTEGWRDFQIHRASIEPADGTHDVYFRFSRRGDGRLFDIGWFYFHDSVAGLSSKQRTELLAKREQIVSVAPETRTPILLERAPDVQRKTHVFDRGNWMDPLEEVQPGVPQTMPPFPADAPRNRLGLAKWIVSSDNPLTARVIVNRFWAEIFGTGIVETLEDFGSQGAHPSHPELLDWLALEFVESHDWSVKQLLKQIVMSATYRQRSSVQPQVYERDPMNRLLARGPRIRLTAEQIRDQALAVSGLLSEKKFGPSVMPHQPDGIWRAPYSSAKWEMSEGEDRYRRGLYTYWRRGAPYPSMVTFDSPSRELCVSRRISTNTPLQALVTLNDPVYVESATALADRMMEEGGSQLEDRIRAGFLRALVRDPLPEEMEVLKALYSEAYFGYQDQKAGSVQIVESEKEPEELEKAAFAVVAGAILNLDEFITKG